ESAGAAANRILAAGLLIDLAHRMAAADRADRRELERPGIGRPPSEIDIDDLRDDVAGALHGHGVADAEILAVTDRRAVGADRLDVVLLVQRSVGPHDTAHGDP